MNILLLKSGNTNAQRIIRRTFFGSKEYKPETSAERRKNYKIPEKTEEEKEQKVNADETAIAHPYEKIELPYYVMGRKEPSALTKILISEWHQNEKKTAFLPVYRNLGIVFTLMLISTYIGIKEARYPGGYLYESDISLAFVGDFETREWKELNRIRKILYQIEQIQKEEERVKKLRAEAKDNEVEKTDEVTCYKFPIYSPVPQVKVPIFQADY